MYSLYVGWWWCNFSRHRLIWSICPKKARVMKPNDSQRWGIGRTLNNHRLTRPEAYGKTDNGPLRHWRKMKLFNWKPNYLSQIIKRNIYILIDRTLSFASYWFSIYKQECEIIPLNVDSEPWSYFHSRLHPMFFLPLQDQIDIYFTNSK